MSLVMPLHPINFHILTKMQLFRVLETIFLVRYDEIEGNAPFWQPRLSKANNENINQQLHLCCSKIIGLWGKHSERRCSYAGSALKIHCLLLYHLQVSPYTCALFVAVVVRGGHFVGHQRAHRRILARGKGRDEQQDR